jgi:GDP-fucose transporter C1
MSNKEAKTSIEKLDYRHGKSAKSVGNKNSSTLIALVVAFYFAISLSVVFLNKFLLSSTKYEFPYPLFITWFQLVVALVILLVSSEFGK